jgi:hypothetical protein
MTTALIWAGAMIAVAAMACLAGLKAWRGWLDVRRYEIAAARPAPELGLDHVIEIADIRERLRKLEAIAQGVDL